MTLVLFKNQDQDDFLFFHGGFQLITFNQPHPLPLKIKIKVLYHDQEKVTTSTPTY